MAQYIIAMAMLTRVKVAASRDFFVKSLLHFCNFFVNPNFDLEINCIFRKPMTRRFQRYTACMKILSIFHTRVKYKIHSKMPFKLMGVKNPQ